MHALEKARERLGERGLLGVGLLQQCAPELVVVFGVTVDQFSVDGGQPVVDHHVHPLPKHPELKVKDAGVFLRVLGIPLLILVIRNDLRL